MVVPAARRSARAPTRARHMRLLQRHIPVRDTQRETLRFRTRAIAGFALIALCLAGLGRTLCVLAGRPPRRVQRALGKEPHLDPPHRAIARLDLRSQRRAAGRQRRCVSTRGTFPNRPTISSATLDALSDVIAVSRRRHRALQSTASRPSTRSKVCRCASSLSEDEIARFSVNRWRFPGVDVVPYLTRSYPRGQEFAHVVGYVGRIDATDGRTSRPKPLRRNHSHRQDRHRALLRRPAPRRTRLRADRSQRRQTSAARTAGK